MNHLPPNRDADTKILPVDDKVVSMGNAIPVDPDGFTNDELNFLKDLEAKIQANTLDPYTPSTLINQEIYKDAEQKARGMADMTAVNLCSKIRQIQDLVALSGLESMCEHPSYQAKHLVMDLKYQKEIFEKQYGDLFII